MSFEEVGGSILELSKMTTTQDAGTAEAGEIMVKHRSLSRRKKCCICTGVTVGIVLVLIIIIIVLIFTLFKAKDPRININSVELQNFNTSINLPTLQPSITLILKLNLTVENPNRADFDYSSGTTYLFYHGEEVGEALIPAGKISALGKETMSTLVHIQADRFIANSNLLSDINLGLLPVSSQTVLSGRVRVLKIIKRHATATAVCDVVVSVSSRNVQSLHCSYKVKL